MSIKLFHAYVSPIMLYNVENWATMTNKCLQNFSTDTFMRSVNDNKSSIIHRKYLKYVLGVSRSCPNLAVMGETNETPLMIKGYRLMLKYWHRVSKLPDDMLAKKALLENIALRTNWICTIEKLLNLFQLTNNTDTVNKFNNYAKKNAQEIYTTWWENNTRAVTSRLEFYNTIKDDLKFEEYLNIPEFHIRKGITKIRCSDHILEIEKGRHLKIPRADRICKFCSKNAIESEVHFLTECDYYDDIKRVCGTKLTLLNLFHKTNLESLGKFIISALEKLQKVTNKK